MKLEEKGRKGKEWGKIKEVEGGIEKEGKCRVWDGKERENGCGEREGKER